MPQSGMLYKYTQARDSWACKMVMCGFIWCEKTEPVNSSVCLCSTLRPLPVLSPGTRQPLGFSASVHRMSHDGMLCVLPPSSAASNLQREIRLDEVAFRRDPSLAFFELAASPTFREVYWERQPFVLTACDRSSRESAVSSLWSLELQMARMRAKKRSSSQRQFFTQPGQLSFRAGHFPQSANATVQQKRVLQRLKRGSTWAVNYAEAVFPELRMLVARAQRAFGLPSALNTYISPPGHVAAPLHTDRMNSFVLQTEGSKRWRIYEPPTMGALPVIDAGSVERGKDGDVR